MRGCRAKSGALLCFLSISLFSVANDISGHRGPVLSLEVFQDQSKIITGGADGFINIWSLSTHTSLERFQVSPYRLIDIALRPGSREMAVLESDGIGLFRVSVWDLQDKKKLCTLRFRDEVTSVSYSAQGSYLLVTRNALDGLLILDPTAGERVVLLEEETGPISFATTGKSERTIAAYSQTGNLSYWDLTLGRRLAKITVPASLAQIVFFGNNRYFLGIDVTSMRVIDALSGEEKAFRSVEGQVFAYPINDQMHEVGFFHQKGNIIANGTVDTFGITPEFSPWEKYILYDEERFLGIVAAVRAKGKLLLALESGDLGFVDEGDPYQEIDLFETADMRPISDFALVGESLFAVSQGALLSLPADPYSYRQSLSIAGRQVDHARSIASIGRDSFAFWDESAEEPYLIVMSKSNSIRVPLAPGAAILAIKSIDRYMLILDSVSGVRIFDTFTMDTIYSYSSVGLIDAEFLDDSRVVLGKSIAVAPYVAMLEINFKTGETVPRDIGGTAAVRIHLGEQSGNVYAFLVGEGTTTLVRFDPRNPERTTALLEYASEDVQPFVAEGPDFLAAILGGDGSVLYSESGVVPFQRTRGLPKKISALKEMAIVLDTDGGIEWHETDSGKNIASLRLQGETWTMNRDGQTLTGAISSQAFGDD